MLGGSKFFFNSYGIMCGANNILQKGVNINGIRKMFFSSNGFPFCVILALVYDAFERT